MVESWFNYQFVAASFSLTSNVYYKSSSLLKGASYRKTYYVCGYCKAAFIFTPPACPQCHAEMRKIKYEDR